MDNSQKFSLMLDKAIKQDYKDFKGFDRSKNVQDQLQEIIDKIDAGSDAYVIQIMFQDWFDDFNPDEWDFSWSMEMLWLAFLMEYKYQKIWDDEKEKWVIKE